MHRHTPTPTNCAHFTIFYNRDLVYRNTDLQLFPLHTTKFNQPWWHTPPLYTSLLKKTTKTHAEFSQAQIHGFQTKIHSIISTCRNNLFCSSFSCFLNELAVILYFHCCQAPPTRQTAVWNLGIRTCEQDRSSFMM